MQRLKWFFSQVSSLNCFTDSQNSNWKWRGMWPICALDLTHLKCTHTAVNTHTHTHTHGAVGSYLCLAQGHLSRGIEDRALYIHSPTYNSCWSWDLNSQPLAYESNSLTIRPRFPLLLDGGAWQEGVQMMVRGYWDWWDDHGIVVGRLNRATCIAKCVCVCKAKYFLQYIRYACWSD